jgi:hypothetical protein
VYALKNLAGFSGALSSGQRYAKLICKRTTLLLRRSLRFAKKFLENLIKCQHPDFSPVMAKKDLESCPVRSSNLISIAFPTGWHDKAPSEKVKVLPRYVESRPADVQNLIQ